MRSLPAIGAVAVIFLKIYLMPLSVAAVSGDGNILKRPADQSCHACHRTDRNTPSPGEPGYVETNWESAIKMHGSDILGACSNSTYQTRKACEGNSETWTPGKWGPAGWGTSGGQYGLFQCTTCHTAHSTRNIYLIRQTIRTPSGIDFNWGSTNSVGVDFRTKSGSAGTTVGIMGDDSSGRTTSSNICEVCHSMNKYHNYDSSRNVDGEHNNAGDCSACHSHKKSFKPGCNSCHGAPPTAGEQKHAVHVGTGTSTYGNTTVRSTASAYRFSCGICHSGAHMNSIAPNPRTVEVNFAGLAVQGNASGASYSPGSSSVDSPSGSSYTFNYSGGACTDVYCHGNYPGSGKNASPTFLGTAACGSCHEAGNAAVPSSGSHSRHTLSVNYNLSCTLCHKNIVGGGGPSSYTIADKSKHVNGLVDWRFDTTDARLSASLSPSASYSIESGSQTPTNGTARSFGSCTNLYCHSNANPASNTDPKRNVLNEFKTVAWGGASLQCYSCHKGQVSDNTQANCASTGGTWDTYCATTQGLCEGNGGTWDQARKVCTNVADSLCNGVLKGRWVEICGPTLTMSSNAHLRLVGPQWIRKYPCTYCHGATIDSSGNITDKTKHLNAFKDVVISSAWNIDWTIPGQPAPSYNHDTKVCSNLYCHSDGTSDPEHIRDAPWNGPKTECNSCHGHPQGGCSTTNCHDGTTLPQICAGIPQDICEANSGLWSGAPSPGICRGITNAKCASLGGAVRWPDGQDWMASMPMFPNQGPGTRRANSHARHVESNFTCDTCHYATVKNGVCTECHTTGIPEGDMGEVAHVDAAYHVNKNKDVVFRDLSWRYYVNTGNPNTDKTCQNSCHIGGNPQWGGSLSDGTTICLSCHGTTGDDLDYYGIFTNNPAIRPLINLTEWYTNGHGRPASAGNYPSGNPPANFPGNPCWYCHDNKVLHTDSTNPFRLKKHDQFKKRFEKECVYCHMQGQDSECLGCHNTEGSLAVQLGAIGYLAESQWPDGSPAGSRPDHNAYTDGLTSCISSDCHYVDPATPKNDLKRHNSGAGLWTAEQEKDIKNQYIWMGVCLKCHDDDGNNGSNCSGCHPDYNQPGSAHKLGYDPGTGFITAQKAKAASVHFGYKHYNYFMNTGGWTKDASNKYTGTMKGGKFCWDCHDPHGDRDKDGNYNIHMIHRKVATATDGVFGKPVKKADDTFTQAEVSFTRKVNGLDYAKSSPPYNGICNVCHETLYDGGNNVLVEAKHYTNNYGDHHNEGRVCTTCHEHRFTDSHSSGAGCNTCHMSKPIPRHSGFGLPRDCTLCHKGTVGGRMDVVGQMTGNSHHVQGITLSNKHCYACHWEATSIGLIDVNHHIGYNYKTHESVKNSPSDLVIWTSNTRPTTYVEGVTATTFDATKVGTASERGEVLKTTTHCLGCHSDQNNETKPFAYCSIPAYISTEGRTVYVTTEADCTAAGGTWITDCKTPKHYAWDHQSIAARYSQTGTTSWGKYLNVAHSVILPMDEAYWNGTSSEVKDKSPNGNNGTAYNATTVGWGRFERAGSFNGTNSYISVPASSSLNVTGPISISVWLRLNVLPTATQTVLVGAGQYVLFVTSTGDIIFRDNNGHGVTTSGANLDAGTWYHVTAVFSGTLSPATAVSTDNTKVYVNGVEQAASVSGAGNWTPSTSNPALYIGSSGGTSNFFNGLIDEIVIYKSALTASHILTLAQGTVEYIGCDSGICSAAPKNFTKAYSAHGNAGANQGGWDNSTTTCSGAGVTSGACSSNGGTWSGSECLNLTQGKCTTTLGGSWTSMRGLDGDLTGRNMRAGTYKVECFDCHSSHGSKLTGNTSSYTTTYGPNGAGPYGGNLKETSAGKGGYGMTYKASSNASGVNPYGAGAGQCFDCHETAYTGACSNPSYSYKTECESNGGTWTASGKPWGYSSTYGASAPIIGYKDTLRFGQGVKASQGRYTYRANKNTIVGGHLKASTSLNNAAQSGINGLCTPCHDPHGVSPTLGSNQAYGVPLLKGTWLTSPYKEDAAQSNTGNPNDGNRIRYNTDPTPYVYNDKRTFGGTVRITESDSQFAGLCLNCHPKGNLTGGTNTTAWKSMDRIHGSVPGWGGNSEHSFPCSKCHQPHNSGLRKLMQTNCLDVKHRGRVISGGSASGGGGSNASGGFPKGYGGGGIHWYGVNCHPTGTWPDNTWNDKTPW